MILSGFTENGVYMQSIVVYCVKIVYFIPSVDIVHRSSLVFKYLSGKHDVHLFQLGVV